MYIICLHIFVCACFTLVQIIYNNTIAIIPLIRCTLLHFTAINIANVIFIFVIVFS